MTYDILGGFIKSFQDVVNVTPPYKWELILFGPLFGGQIPCYFFEYFQVIHAGQWFKILFDVSGALFYVLHFPAPFIMGWIFWGVARDRCVFIRFVYTLTLLNIMGLATYILYPAAPPWYVYLYGLTQPVGEISGSAAGLVNFDQLIGYPLLQSVWNNFNATLFGAIPSLHGAHAVVMAVFGMQKFSRLRPLWLIHPIGTFFAAVYLNEHYIIDLIIGSAYVIIAYLIIHRILYPRVLSRLVDCDGWTMS